MANYFQDAWRTLPGNALLDETIPGFYGDVSDSVSQWNPERTEQRFDFGRAPQELQALQGKYTHSYVDPVTKRLTIMGLQQPGGSKYDVWTAHYNFDPESGQYVLDSADEQKMRSTFSKLATTIGPVLAAGAVGALTAGAVGGGTTAAAAGDAALGGTLPSFGAELGSGVVGGTDLLGSSLLTGGAGIGEVGGALTAGAAGAPTLGGALPSFGAELGMGLVGGTDLTGSSLLTGGTGLASGGPGFSLPGGALTADAGAALTGGSGSGGGGLIENGLSWLAEQAGFPEISKWLEGSGLARDLLGLFGAGMQQWNIEKVAEDQRKWIDSKEAAARQRRAPVRGTAGVLRVVGD